MDRKLTQTWAIAIEDAGKGIDLIFEVDPTFVYWMIQILYTSKVRKP